jgi:5-methylcytosine-specific restriction endonuclease McrA
MNVLHKKVLVLNRGWMPVGIVDTKHAILQLAAGAATALDIEDGGITPLKWEDWITLKVRPQDDAVHSAHFKIRRPTVISCVEYAKMPKRTPKFNLKGIGARDGWRDQYSNEPLDPSDASIDHVIPRSRGGENSWLNSVLCKRETNHKKGARTPEEAGLKLVKKPSEPRSMPASAFIQPHHPDHEIFLKK